MVKANIHLSYEGEALVVGYKDALLVYQMMNTLLEQQVHLSKLKAVYANTDTMQALAVEAQTLLNSVTCRKPRSLSCYWAAMRK